MVKRSKTQNIEIVCPNCNEVRPDKSLSFLFKWRKQYSLPNMGIKEDYKVDKEEELRWACDICIKTKKVILAQPDKQDYSYHPYFVYLDINRICNSCNDPYVYTKEEQHFWYEELGKNYWSRANNCLKCRIERREKFSDNKKLSKLISNLDLTSEESLLEVIEFYYELGKIDKAKYYLSKLRKISKNKEIDISSIESKINNA